MSDPKHHFGAKYDQKCYEIIFCFVFGPIRNIKKPACGGALVFRNFGPVRFVGPQCGNEKL